MPERALHFYVDLKTENFTNIAYGLHGIDTHIGKIHSHEGFEIIQVLSDQGNMLIKDKVYPFSKGSIYILNGVEPHCSNPDDPSTYIRSKITFSPTYIKDLFAKMGYPYILDGFTDKRLNASHRIVPDQKLFDEFDRLFGEMALEMAEKRPCYAANITACLIKMLIMIDRQREKNIPQHMPNQEHISAMMDYIGSHLSSQFSIQQMCESLHISKFYACHLFKNVTGMTIMQYLTERRISEAKMLLLLTNKTISEIAIDAGFSSFSIFSRTFGKITGQTPLQYRKLHHKI